MNIYKRMFIIDIFWVLALKFVRVRISSLLMFMNSGYHI